MQGKNTPLHLAAMFEKTKHAELLLEYGANPAILNEYGMNPLQLLPKDATRSTKLYFKKMFEVSIYRTHFYYICDDFLWIIAIC